MEKQAYGALAGLLTGAAIASPVISEFIVVNDSILADSDGDFSDWIEIHNPTATALQLDGYSLSDDPDSLSDWTFPSGTTLAPGAYLIVFASENAQLIGGELRANFKLSGSGEFLALSDPAGNIVDAFDPSFPAQFPDISYGRSPSGSLVFFPSPTPGQPNGSGVADPATQISFAPPSRTFTGNLSISLSNSDPTAPIFYTTDGSDPTTASLQYSSPLTLSSTTGFRARTIRPGNPPGPVVTSSYHRLASDVAAFSSPLPIVVIDNFGQGPIPDKRVANPPAGDGGGITQVDRQPAGMLIFEKNGPSSSLASLPTISTRIGSRVRGSSSASQPLKRENLSIETWSAIDEEKMEIAPFAMPSSDEWVLYAPYNYDRSLIRNALIYELMRRAGHYAPRTQFVEVFINTEGDDLSMDDFAGVYVFLEKIKRDKNRVDVEKLSDDGTEGGWIIESNRLDPLPADGSATPPRNFHTAGPNLIKQGPYGGSSSADRGGDDLPTGYNTFFNFVSPSGYNSSQAQRDRIINWFDQFEDVLYSDDYRDPQAGYRRYLHTPSFIDHFLMVNLARNVDGLQLSTFLHKPDTYSKLRLNPPWDYDRSMDSYDGRDNSTTGQWGKNFLWFPRLFSDPEFEQQVDDRWQELRADVLSTANISALIDELEAEITAPVAAANFARWNASNNRPRSGGWPAEITHLKTWLTARLNWLDSPLVAQPVLASSSSLLDASSPDGGTVYFTLDGSDPRLPDFPGTTFVILPEFATATGLIPSIANGGSQLAETWKGADEPFDDSAWLSGTTGFGYNYANLIGLDVSAMRGQNGSAFLRVPFQIPSTTRPLITELFLNLKWEDGFVAYLNGVEVASMNEPTPLLWNSTTGVSHGNATVADSFDLTPHLSALKSGTNILSFHVLNSSINNSDLLALPQLVATTGSSGGPSSSAIIYTGSETFTEPKKVTARVLQNGSWSAPVTQHFLVNTIPATANNLVISEIMYRPADASETEILSDFSDRDDFEFLEFLNTSDTAFIDLSAVNFTAGLTFDFTSADLRFLAPGSRLILVKNREAFSLRYGSEFPIAGTYRGSLSNDGELITLLDSSASEITTFTYNDQLPWPTSPDGSGDSLELAQSSSPNDSFSWLPSSITGGTPGFDRFLPGPTNPSADLDNDGLDALLEHALGTSDTDPSSGSAAITIHPDGDTVTFSHLVNLRARDLTRTLESSADLLNWSPESAAQLSERSNGGNGNEIRSWLIPQTEQKKFLRLKVAQ